MTKKTTRGNTVEATNIWNTPVSPLPWPSPGKLPYVPFVPATTPFVPNGGLDPSLFRKPTEAVRGSIDARGVFIQLIVDRSSSMGAYYQTYIESFNKYLHTQQRDALSNPFPTSFALTLFDHEVTPVLLGDPIASVADFSPQNYILRGSTALLAAVGITLNDLLSRTNIPPKVVIIVLTDGQENSSGPLGWDKNKVKSLVERVYGRDWVFSYLGAGIDAWSDASTIGTYQNMTLSFDPQETSHIFARASVSTTSYARGEVDNKTFYDQSGSGS